eukprot:IDg14100t1
MCSVTWSIPRDTSAATRVASASANSSGRSSERYHARQRRETARHSATDAKCGSAAYSSPLASECAAYITGAPGARAYSVCEKRYGIISTTADPDARKSVDSSVVPCTPTTTPASPTAASTAATGSPSMSTR